MLLIGVTNVIIGTAFGMAATWSATTAQHCKLFSLSLSYSGRYCPATDGIVSIDLLPHQCRYLCLQATACKAYNYNVTDRTCMHFTSPCPLAVVDTMMEFAVFTEQKINQCYQWVSYSSGDSVDARMIYSDEPKRIICRMQKDGNDIVCNYNTKFSKCYASLGNSEFKSDQGYPCQRLRIIEGCTVFWVYYTAGDLINPRAVIAGHMANGDAVYVTKFNYNMPPMFSLSGHYVEGAHHTFGTHKGTFQSSTSMMMLVVL